MISDCGDTARSAFTAFPSGNKASKRHLPVKCVGFFHVKTNPNPTFLVAKVKAANEACGFCIAVLQTPQTLYKETSP